MSNESQSHPTGNHDGRSTAQTTNVRWWVFILAGGTSWLLYLHRYTFALVKGPLQEEWDLSNSDMGLLDGVFSLCYAIFQFPLGFAADALGVRSVLTALILLWCLGLALHAWAPSLGVLGLARATLGVGQSAVYACISRLTRFWFPTDVRTTLQGWVGVAGGRLGGLCANLVFATVLLGVMGLEWRTAIYLFVGTGIAWGLLFLVTFRNSPREHPRINEAEVNLIEAGAPPDRTRMKLGEIVTCMSRRSSLNLLCLNIQSILSTMADNIFSNWIPLFLYSVHELQFKEMGFYSALPLLGGALGGIVGGWLNDRFIRVTGNRRWARSGVAIVGKGTAAILIICSALLAYDSPRTFCIMLFFVKLFSDWSLSSGWGTVTDIGGRATASVFSFNNAIATLGAVGAPIMYGYVSDEYSWRLVFLIAGGAYTLCALSWLLVNCTIPVLQEEPKKDEPTT